MFTNPIVLWFLVAVIFLAVDKMQNRFSLSYASYAAFTISIFLMIGVMRTPDSETASYYFYFVIGQIIFFFLAIGLFAFMFRDTAPKAKVKRSKEFYDSIIGRTVEVGEDGINSVSGGKINLDGEVMRVQLAKNIEIDSVEAGTKVIIKEIVGDCLIVIPKN